MKNKYCCYSYLPFNIIRGFQVKSSVSFQGLEGNGSTKDVLENKWFLDKKSDVHACVHKHVRRDTQGTFWLKKKKPTTLKQ